MLARRQAHDHVSELQIFGFRWNSATYADEQTELDVGEAPLEVRSSRRGGDIPILSRRKAGGDNIMPSDLPSLIIVGVRVVDRQIPCSRSKSARTGLSSFGNAQIMATLYCAGEKGSASPGFIAGCLKNGPAFNFGVSVSFLNATEDRLALANPLS